MDNFKQIYDQYKSGGEQQAIREANQQAVFDGKEQIVAVRKNEDGDIIAIKTNSGRELGLLFFFQVTVMVIFSYIELKRRNEF